MNDCIAWKVISPPFVKKSVFLRPNDGAEDRSVEIQMTGTRRPACGAHDQLRRDLDTLQRALRDLQPRNQEARGLSADLQRVLADRRKIQIFCSFCVAVADERHVFRYS